jgi:hypothetical protein
MQRLLLFLLVLANFFIVATFLISCNRLSKKTADAQAIKELSKDPGINACAGTFSIGAPHGWKNYDTTISGVRFRLIMAPRDGGVAVTPNMNILTEKMNGLTLDEYFEAARKGALKMHGFMEIGTGRKDLHGIQGKWLQYSFVSRGGTKMESIFTVFAADDISYDVTMLTGFGEMSRFKPSFDSALNSFTLEKPIPVRVSPGNPK